MEEMAFSIKSELDQNMYYLNFNIFLIKQIQTLKYIKKIYLFYNHKCLMILKEFF